jgi:SSS family solute:Na+ symporter
MNFLHFAIVLFVVCSATLVLVSLWTRPPDAARVAPLTVQHGRGSAAADPPRAADVALSAALVALVVAAWLYFS